MTTQSFTLTIPTDRIHNSNHRGHWSVGASKRREMRRAAADAYVYSHEPTPFPGPVHLDVTFAFPDARARDLDNIEIKGAIDGLVDAGVLTDDNSKRLVSVTRRAAQGRSPKGCVVLTFTLTDQEVPL